MSSWLVPALRKMLCACSVAPAMPCGSPVNSKPQAAFSPIGWSRRPTAGPSRCEREPICCPMSWPTQNTGAGCHGQHTGQLTKLPCIDALMTAGNANANAGECRQSGAAHLLTSCLGPRNGPQLAVGRDRGRVLSEHEVDGSGGSPAGRPGSRPQRFQPDGSFLERAVGCQVFLGCLGAACHRHLHLARCMERPPHVRPTERTPPPHTHTLPERTARFSFRPPRIGDQSAPRSRPTFVSNHPASRPIRPQLANTP